jgi:tRNA A-37 threonylcarbamoyl transferase component Bud32
MKRLNTFNHSEDKDQESRASMLSHNISMSPQNQKRKLHLFNPIDIKISLPKSSFSLENNREENSGNRTIKGEHLMNSPPQKLKCEKFTKRKNMAINPEAYLKQMKNVSSIENLPDIDDKEIEKEHIIVEKDPKTCKILEKNTGTMKSIRSSDDFFPRWNSDKDLNQGGAELEENVASYLVIKHLNKGYQARVSLVKDLKRNNKKFIAKILLDGDDQEVKRTIVNEFRILLALVHDGLIKVDDLFIPEENKNILVMIEEYFEGATLKEILDAKSHQFSEDEILKIMRQLLSVVDYIHKQNISHRDLTIDNVLYCTKTQKIKVIDFGLAKQVDRGISEESFNELDMLSATGAIWYRAPEMIRGDYYTEKVDLWMCGMIFLQLFLGNPKIYTKKVVKQVRENEDWKIESKKGKDIIKMLLNIDQRKRVSAQDALTFFDSI